MPLQPQAEPPVGMLDALDHPVRGQRVHPSAPRIAHRLVVRRVHLHAPGADDPRQQRVRLDAHRMAGFVAGIGLLVRQRALDAVRDVLDQRAAQCHRQQLLSAADAEDRHVALQGAAQQHHLGAGAALLEHHRLVLLVDAVEPGIDVEGAPGDDQRIDRVEHVFGDLGMMRQRHRQPAGLDQAAHVVLAQRVPGIGGIGRSLPGAALLAV